MAQASFDFISDRFVGQRIKVQKVICQDCDVQESGEISIEGDNPNFFLVPVTIDPLTGHTQQGGIDVTITAVPAPGKSPFLTNTTVSQGKVKNDGVVPVTVLVNGTPQIVGNILQIPFSGILDCEPAMPGDTVQKHDVQLLTPIPVSARVSAINPAVAAITFEALLDMCVIVTSERVLKINAAEEFC